MNMDYKNMKAIAYLSLTLLPLSLSAVQVASLDSLPFPDGQDYYNGADNAGGFTDAGIHFSNSFTDFGSFTVWDGFAYSRVNDTETPGFGNQYAAITGSGVGGGGVYAIAYDTGTLSLSTEGSVQYSGFYITNTTYAALSMMHGDDFSKKFGGVNGTDPDFFALSIQGYAGGQEVSTLSYYLADFRSEDSGDDYILTDWSWVDLTALGTVDELRFSLSSSDNGQFGMNTPAYFAMDDLTIVPEPSFYAALLSMGVLVWIVRRRRV